MIYLAKYGDKKPFWPKVMRTFPNFNFLKDMFKICFKPFWVILDTLFLVTFRGGGSLKFLSILSLQGGFPNGTPSILWLNHHKSRTSQVLKYAHLPILVASSLKHNEKNHVVDLQLNFCIVWQTENMRQILFFWRLSNSFICGFQNGH